MTLADFIASGGQPDLERRALHPDAPLIALYRCPCGVWREPGMIDRDDQGRWRCELQRGPQARVHLAAVRPGRQASVEQMRRRAYRRLDGEMMEALAEHALSGDTTKLERLRALRQDIKRRHPKDVV